jgi:hypothetical protein
MKVARLVDEFESVPLATAMLPVPARKMPIGEVRLELAKILLRLCVGERFLI